MVIVHCYVSLPDGIPSGKSTSPKWPVFYWKTHLPSPLFGRIYVHLLEGAQKDLWNCHIVVGLEPLIVNRMTCSSWRQHQAKCACPIYYYIHIYIYNYTYITIYIYTLLLVVFRKIATFRQTPNSIIGIWFYIYAFYPGRYSFKQTSPSKKVHYQSGFIKHPVWFYPALSRQTMSNLQQTSYPLVNMVNCQN